MSSRLGYVPALDGLRGVAILLVLCGHFFHLPAGAGRGVDLFFVLSGFLITTLLLEERAATGRISFRAFYERRARRLLPALVAMLLVYVAKAGIRGREPFPYALAYGLYTANVFLAYMPHAFASGGLEHLWSLAEEEQFYVVWPLALVVLVRTRRALLWVALLAVGLAAWRAGYVLIAHPPVLRVYNAPDMHADGLLIGCWAAVLRFRHGLRRSEALANSAFLTAAGCVLVLPSLTLFFGLELPLFELAAAALVIAAASGTAFAEAAGWKPLVAVGRVSYSLYLWHEMLLWQFGGSDRIAVLALSVGAAYASYRWVETPFLRGRPRGLPVTADAG